jgi:HprK-related kinase A
MLHSGVIEKYGHAVIFPAWPGSGKSTLTAALVNRGWRLLSDEFGLIRPEDGLLIPFPRPIPLKNQSIAVIREFAPDAVLGPVYPKTRKGDVAHLKPPTESVERAQEAARPTLIVFPRYAAGESLELAPMAKSRAFLKVSGNAFNYEIQGARGFKAIAALIKACGCYRLSYSRLDDAIAALDQLISEHGAC